MRVSPRRRAREFVLQGLYQRQLSGNARRCDPRAACGGGRVSRRRTKRISMRCGPASPPSTMRSSLLSPRISTAGPPSCRRSSARFSSSARGSSKHRRRDPLPRRDQRGDRAREVVRRHRRAQVRQRRAGQARRDAARRRDGRDARARPAPPELDASRRRSPPARAAPSALAGSPWLRRRLPRDAWPSTARTIPMPASSRRRRSRATRGSSSRWCASPPAKYSRSSAPSATIRKPTSGTAARSTPFLQGAAEGLFAAYRSPRTRRALPMGAAAGGATGDRAVAIYRIVLGFGTNPAVLARQQRCARRGAGRTSSSPSTGNEVELSNPVTSGTGYTILATLVALYGEDGAFDYLKRLAPERRSLHAVRHRAGALGRARRSGHRRQLRPRIRHAAARGLSRRHRDSVRRYGRRARRHGDHRQRPQSRRRRGCSTTGRSRAVRRSSRTARAT